jgi:hypothetical protein
LQEPIAQSEIACKADQLDHRVLVHRKAFITQRREVSIRMGPEEDVLRIALC